MECSPSQLFESDLHAACPRATEASADNERFICFGIVWLCALATFVFDIEKCTPILEELHPDGRLSRPKCLIDMQSDVSVMTLIINSERFINA